ncbi:conserved hypothetical protein [Culex quinquefasciatus]|uniref:Uncharacterized protein n=1 Tax=Culex quinquefasciatus TaxID=7176 RepID=B0WKI7_CULQU|nr:conserved hypothetical protein [Culex quinquefasciatus]|eukprot:XP_001849221.1 conserved hypothetical protein [Culex quinquefasciatus]
MCNFTTFVECVDAKSRPTLFEKIILSLGTLLFFAAGGLVFASIDQVHPDLHDNAIILGCLSFLVAILFIIDLADPLARMTSHMSQTESAGISPQHELPPEKRTLKKDVSTDTVEPATVTAQPVYLIEQDHDRYRDAVGPDRHGHHQDYPDGAAGMLIGNQGYREHRDEPERRSYRREPQRRYFDRDEPERRSTESIVERKILPSVQVPVFAHVRAAEESRRIAGKEIQYLPIRYERREYRDAGQPRPQHQHQSKAPPPSYHDNDSFVEDITPSRRSTYVPGDKYDNDVVMPVHNPRPRPPPPAKPSTASPSNSANSSCDGCRCSQRSSPPKKTGGFQRQAQQKPHKQQQHQHHQQEQQQQQPPMRDEPNQVPIKPGYVANVARKWDDRVRSKSQPIIGLNTMV